MSRKQTKIASSLVEQMAYDTDEFDQPEFKLTRIVEPKIRYTSFDTVLRRAGLFGRYQIFCCVVVQYATILWAGMDSFQILGFLEPDWICHDNNVTYTNLFEDERNCSLARNCSRLTPTNIEFNSTIIDFGLACDQPRIMHVLICSYLVGRLSGSLVAGLVGDYLGRKKGFFGAQFLITMTSVLTIGSYDWRTLTVFQTLNGFFFGIIQVTLFTLTLEYTDSKYRLIPNACFQWIVGYMVVAVVSFLTKDSWRMYLIFINLISAPLLIGFLLFLESPRWLVAKNKLSEAAEILNDLAGDRWNNTGAKFSADQLKKIPNDKRFRCYTILSLFSSKRLAVLSCLQMLAIFSYSLINSLFLVNIGSVEISIYTHFFLYGLLRIWVPVVAVVMDFKLPRFGRKHLFLACVAGVGLCFGAIAVALVCGVSAESKAVYAVALIGNSINVSGFYIAVSQISLVAYPTVARSIAFGTLTFTDAFASLISELFLTKLLADWQPWPYIIAEFLILLTYLLALWLLPETKFRSLPDTMEQANVRDSALDVN